jgi:hypothetical protein
VIENIKAIFPLQPRRSMDEEHEYRALEQEFGMYEFWGLTNSEDGWVKMEGTLGDCMAKRAEGRFRATRIKAIIRDVDQMTDEEKKRYARYYELGGMWPPSG